MLEKNDEVIAAYPHGDTGQVEIHAKKADVYTKATVAKVIETDKQFTVKSFTKKVVAAEKKAETKTPAKAKKGSAGGKRGT